MDGYMEVGGATGCDVTRYDFDKPLWDTIRKRRAVDLKQARTRLGRKRKKMLKNKKLRKIPSVSREIFQLK